MDKLGVRGKLRGKLRGKFTYCTNQKTGVILKNIQRGEQNEKISSSNNVVFIMYYRISKG